VALVTVAEVKARMAPAQDGSKDAEIALCVAGAQQYVVQGARLEAPATAATVHLNGCDAEGGAVLYMPPGQRRMVTHAGEDLVTVKENGTALTVAATLGYSTSAEVMLDGANQDRVCRLVRGNSTSIIRWAWGYQNIEVVFKSGYTSANVPDHIKHLLCAVAWKMFTGGTIHQVSSVSDPSGSTVLDRSLSPIERDILEDLRRSW